MDAERTRERILASALALFSKKGYDHTTFTDIAARLKMTKGAVYWHFASKDRLLVELVRLALAKFRRQIDALMPKGELTFPAVAEMMVRNAEQVIGDPRGAAFFRLMHGQIRWTDPKLAAVRRELEAQPVFGPHEAFLKAVESDLAAGRVRADVHPVAVASAALALWDGLVKARLDDFLQCDLSVTLRNFYNGMWHNIQIKER